MAPPESAPPSPTKKKQEKPALTKAKSKRPQSSLRMAKDWHVNTVPPKTSLKGKIMPGFLSHQRRRLSVEVYQFQYADNSKPVDKDHPGYYEEAYIRLLKPQTKEQMQASIKVRKNARRSTAAAVEDAIEDVDVDESASILDGASTILNSGGLMADEDIPVPNYEGWVVRYKLPLKAITFKGIHKKCATFLFDYRTIKQTRKVYFDTEMDAHDCVQFVEAQQVEEDERLRQKYNANTSGIKVNPMEYITLLVEIVGATDLPAGDLTSSDPYVVCYCNHKEVHRTNYVPKSLEPIWTLKTKSLFLISLSAKELFQGDGLYLDIMEYDTVGKDESLGHSVLDPRTMYEAKGERLVLPVEGKNAKGQLAVRVRHATPYDIQFLKEYESSSNKKGNAALNEMLKAANTNKGGKSTIASVLSRNVKTEMHGMGPPIKKYRVHPGPDPRRPEETEWMTMPDMEKEMMEESREWIDAGSGKNGRLFVEVLQCKGLPNMDTGGIVGNKTDGFCCLVFEDIWAQTDIIDDDLDPKWMPWTKRAFIFHLSHPSSELFIGVFDHDAGVDDHDMIGRVAVNVSNLQPDTLYALTYTIYPSGKSNNRDPQGQITIRLRMEIDDDRKLLMSCLEPPKTVYVNVKRKKDFKVLHQCCNGIDDMETYSLATMFAYLDELQSYLGGMLYLKEAIITLLFWRGHHAVKVAGKKYLLPLHSAFLFLIGITVVEYPQLFPSFCFLSTAWSLLASMLFRRHHPNPWMRCKGFIDIFFALLLGDSFPPATIVSNENRDEVLEYMGYWKLKAENEAKAAELAQQEALDEAEEAEQALDAIGDTDTDITTKKGSFIPVSVDPFKKYMEPVQAYLVIACRLLRYVRNIFLWEECYLSFWLAIGSLALSVVCVFVPWFFLIKWTSRVLVWTLCGPWMKLVDIYFYTPMENMTEEEIAEQKLKAKELKKKYLAEAVERARIARERTKKLKTMKKYLFGKFIMKVPVLKDDRYVDFPLPESSAVPYTAKPLALAELAMKEAGYHRVRVPGQNLDGDMIPSMESRTFTEAPVGQATKKHAQAESDTAAYAKVGSIVAGAAVITYYGVPLAASAFSSIAG